MPALVRLIAQYGSIAPDLFFRGTGAVLSGMSREELGALAVLLSWLEAGVTALGPPDYEDEPLYFMPTTDPAEAPVVEIAWKHHWNVEHRTPIPAPGKPIDVWKTLAQRLASHEVIGRTEIGVIMDAPRPAFFVELSRVRRLRQIVE